MKVLNLLQQSFKKVPAFFFKILKQWQTLLFGLVLFLWPLTENIFIKNSGSYIFGKWSPWETLIINPVQIILGVWLFFEFYRSNKSTPNRGALIILGLGILLTILIPNPITISLILIITFLLIQNKTISINNRQQNFLLYICLFQAAIAILQFGLQHDIGLQIINEPNLSLDTKGIAKLALPFWNLELIRSYGTFAHPNILSAFLSLGILCSFNSKTLNPKHKAIIITILALGLLTALSRNSIYLLIILLLASHNQLKANLLKLGIVFLTVSLIFAIRLASPHTNISNNDRINQIRSLSEQTESTRAKILPWDHQPIHNVFLLLWTKYGIYTILIFAVLAYLIKNKPKFWFNGNHQLALLVAISLSDHFLLTLPIGNYLLLIALSFGANNYPLLLPKNQSSAAKIDFPSL